MPSHTPIYGIPAPSPTTELKNLGAELLAMATGFEAALAAFDYDGADPNLVLARTAALEADRERRDLVIDTSVAVSNANIAGSVTVTRQGNAVHLKLTNIRASVANYFATTNLRAIGTIPVGYRPAVEIVDVIGGVDAAAPAVLRVAQITIGTDGIIKIGKWNSTTHTVNSPIDGGSTFFTADAHPTL